LNKIEKIEKTDLAAKSNISLTLREYEIALLAARGLSNKEIAHQANIRKGTVKIHLHSVFQKLGIKRRTMLIARFARDKGGQLAPVTTRSNLDLTFGRRDGRNLQRKSPIGIHPRLS
jgi:DNA-binding CsgD family transcriptional regulator